MSLLKRLGKTKEKAIREVEQQNVEEWRQTSDAKTAPPAAAKGFRADSQGTYSHLPETPRHSHGQMASAFAGRRTAVVEIDQIQELRLAIHRRIVNEMTVNE